jgi:hypothetical protein
LQRNNRIWEQFLIDNGFVKKDDTKDIMRLSSEEQQDNNTHPEEPRGAISRD